MPEYRVGQRLRSSKSTLQVMLVRAPKGDAELTINGSTLMIDAEPGTPSDPADGAGIELGKRYEDEAGTVELLCVAAGRGELALNGAPLAVKVPKPLPASD
ncbi:hypothetical protein [Rhodococcus koreensis]